MGRGEDPIRLRIAVDGEKLKGTYVGEVVHVVKGRPFAVMLSIPPGEEQSVGVEDGRYFEAARFDRFGDATDALMKWIRQIVRKNDASLKVFDKKRG